MHIKSFFLITLVALLFTGAGCIQFGATALGPMGMYRSVNKGEEWSQIAAVPTTAGVGSIAGLMIYRLYSDPSDPNAWYLATRGQGLYYTYDSGSSWQAVKFFAGKFVYGMAVDPKDKCVIFASDGPHVFKTADCGRTWDIIYTEEILSQRFVSLAIDYGNSNIVYGAKLGGDIILSTDGGRSWATIKSFKTTIQHLVADPKQPGRVYVASYRNGLFRSEDHGSNWADMTKGLDAYSGSRSFYRLILNDGQPDSLFWISKYGILRSDDVGISWREIKLLTAPGSVNIYGFAINPVNQNEMYYTGTILGDKNQHLRSTFYKTIDGGKSWVTKKLPTNTVPAGLWMHPVNHSVLLMGFTSLE